MNWTYVFGILGILAILYLIGALRVLRQYERGVVFFLGKFEGVRAPGLIPFPYQIDFAMYGNDVMDLTSAGLRSM